MSCQKYEVQLLDYIEGTLTSDEEKEFKRHLESCPNCQKDLKQQQELFLLLDQEIDNIEIPYDFMEQVQERVYQQPPMRRGKTFGWRIAAVVVALSILLFSTDLTTGMMNGLLQWWQNVEGNQLANGDHDKGEFQGEEVNITSVDQNIRITITQVAADEFGTDLYYEIEDLNQEGYYDIAFITDGLEISPAGLILTEIHRIDEGQQPFVYRGKISLRPIDQLSANIIVTVKRMGKISREKAVDGQSINYIMNSEEVIGDWDFDIPVTIKDIKSVAINQTIEVDDISVTIEEVKLGLTTTVLKYYYQEGNPNTFIIVEKLVSKEGQQYRHQQYHPGGRSFSSLGGGSHSYEAYFEPFHKSINEFEVHFGLIKRVIDLEETYQIDLQQPFPQTFEYLGSTISIDQVKIGNPTILEVSVPESTDRPFDSLKLHFNTNLDESRTGRGYSYGSKEYYFLDKQGNYYTVVPDFFNIADYLYSIKRIDTKYEIELKSDDPTQEVIPTEIIITGYEHAKFLDDTIKIKIK